jgi:predicted HTH transcriptional regulator
MTIDRPAGYLADLVRELCALPRETEWVEFKANDAEPEAIGQYISALGNSAALVGKAFAYLVWGVSNDDHSIVGTDFEPHEARMGNEELESWLLRLLEPKIDFRFFTVEIFDDRIEITNPGEPLVDTQRFVDTPPRSRNEALASLMRRFRVCEERGSGIDKVVSQVELFQLPAPLFESPEGFTRTVLFAHKALSAMDKADRVRACYLHACLCFVTRREMTNTSLRERFGVEEQNRSTVSRLIREAVEAGVIVPADPDAAPKLMRYLPFWASTSQGGAA